MNPEPYQVFVIPGPEGCTYRKSPLTDHASGLPMVVPDCPDNELGKKAPYPALAFPAPEGTPFKTSRLVDADTQLPILLPSTPELEAWGEKAAASAEAFFRTFGTKSA